MGVEPRRAFVFVARVGNHLRLLSRRAEVDPKTKRQGDGCRPAAGIWEAPTNLPFLTWPERSQNGQGITTMFLSVNVQVFVVELLYCAVNVFEPAVRPVTK